MKVKFHLTVKNTKCFKDKNHILWFLVILIGFISLRLLKYINLASINYAKTLLAIL